MTERRGRITAVSKEEALDKLLRAHEAYYDIYQDHEHAGRLFPGYAEFHGHGEQYVLVKRAKLWEVDSHEYLFFDTVERLDTERLGQDIQYMQEHALTKVKPQPNHMSSNLSLVVIADSVDDDAARLLKKTRFRKNFKLGLEGWTDLRLAAVDLTGRRVITNGAGKDMKQTLQANIWPTQVREGRKRFSLRPKRI